LKPYRFSNIPETLVILAGKRCEWKSNATVVDPNSPGILLNEIADERIHLDEGKQVEAKFVLAPLEA